MYLIIALDIEDVVELLQRMYGDVIAPPIETSLPIETLFVTLKLPPLIPFVDVIELAFKKEPTVKSFVKLLLFPATDKVPVTVLSPAIFI